ncbi:hypothetical protein B0J11DRAFT_25962 [Dendryphion nanum]|uniref:Uncharacterized protein n=1 Tax=Dendryphion nanum TaxID=256645 RepID=A0A9P9EJI1_9PLEO|nr:hypothetical protein B0J11DRAFT_25962 [Dendryphion nanum]
MKGFLSVATAVAAIATFSSAHSWVGCTKSDYAVLSKLVAEAAVRPVPKYLDAINTDDRNLVDHCHGFPRGKIDPYVVNSPGHEPFHWWWENAHYINVFENDRRPAAPACNRNQLPGAQSHPNAPIAKARPGETIYLQYQGNGHANGGNVNFNDPGNSVVHWKKGTNGEEGSEIETYSELASNQHRISEQRFNKFSQTFRAPDGAFHDHANWHKLDL